MGNPLAMVGVTVGTGDRVRLCDVSVAFERSTPALIVGPNGAGKSTLIRALAGLERLAQGELRMAGQPLSRRTRAASVSWLPQHPRIEEGLSAAEVVAAARYRFDESHRDSLAAAREALREHGAEALAPRGMDTLSGGEAQRVRLAALRAQEAPWWLLDEPFNHLDPGVRLELLTQVRAHGAGGGGVILVTHDVTTVPWLPGARVLGLDRGRVVLDRPASDPDVPQAVGRLLGIDVRPVPVDGTERWVVAGPA